MKHVLPNLRTAINQPASVHSAECTKTLLSEDVTVMECPAEIPGINSIGNVWKLLNKRAKEKNPRKAEKLD